jgi:hypothetical protein
VLPPDELPLGVPAALPVEAQGDRGQGGRFAPGNAGLSAAGGRARRNKVRLAAKLTLGTLPEGAAFEPYQRAAKAFRRRHCSMLAATVGGGTCGTGPSSMVASASLQLAWSRFFSDRAALTGDTEDIGQASRLMDASRQNLLAAHELCAKEALSRAKNAPPPDVAALLAAGMVRP